MNLVIVDTYEMNLFNAKLPRKFSRGYQVAWDLREALLILWEGKVKKLAIPKGPLPGYDYEEFIEQLMKQKQIKQKPKIQYYSMRRS